MPEPSDDELISHVKGFFEYLVRGADNDVPIHEKIIKHGEKNSSRHTRLFWHGKTFKIKVSGKNVAFRGSVKIEVNNL